MENPDVQCSGKWSVGERACVQGACLGRDIHGDRLLLAGSVLWVRVLPELVAWQELMVQVAKLCSSVHPFPGETG